MRSRIDFDLKDVQRAAQLRRLGRDLHDQAAAISGEHVETTSDVVSRIAEATEYGELIAEGFAEAFVTEETVTHLLSPYCDGQRDRRRPLRSVT